MKVKGGLEIGLVKARECPARFGRFELGAEHVGLLARLGVKGWSDGRGGWPVARPVETCHEVVDGAGKLNLQDCFLVGLEVFGKGQGGALGVFIMCNVRCFFV